MRSELRSFRVAGILCGLLALLQAMPGCARSKDSLDPANLPDAPFPVDPAFLGAACADSVLGLVFRAPAGFQPGDPERVRQIQELVRTQAKPGDLLGQDPRWIWGVPGTPGMFKIARFREPPPQGMNAAWMDAVRSAMQAQVARATVVEDRFRVDGKIAVVRFVVLTETTVFVRAIYQGPRRPPGMVDCVLPRPDYERLAPAVESSLGAVSAL